MVISGNGNYDLCPCLWEPQRYYELAQIPRISFSVPWDVKVIWLWHLSLHWSQAHSAHLRLGDISFLHKYFMCIPLDTSSWFTQLPMPGNKELPMLNISASWPTMSNWLPNNVYYISLLFLQYVHSFTSPLPLLRSNYHNSLSELLKRPLFSLPFRNKEWSF